MLKETTFKVTVMKLRSCVRKIGSNIVMFANYNSLQYCIRLSGYTQEWNLGPQAFRNSVKTRTNKLSNSTQ